MDGLEVGQVVAAPDRALVELREAQGRKGRLRCAQELLVTDALEVDEDAGVVEIRIAPRAARHVARVPPPPASGSRPWPS